MDQQVRGEGRGTLECLPTHLAFKTSFLVRKKIMGCQLVAAEHVTELEDC